jgi:hypothetical protein
MTLEIITSAFGTVGLLAALRMFVELRRWANLARNARIAVSFKQRVMLQAPLVEWMTWAGQLADDEKSNGRVVYRNAHFAVAILGPGRKVPRVTEVIRRVRKARNSNTAPVKE